MNKMQEQVEEFNKALNVSRSEKPGEFHQLDLRWSLIKEEYEEIEKAIKEQDMVQLIDGFCDILYVIFGACYAFNIDLEPFFNEVHKTNMAKLGGPKRADGKILKPEGWEPPKIKEMLENLKKSIV